MPETETEQAQPVSATGSQPLSGITSQQALGLLFGVAFAAALAGLFWTADGRSAFAAVAVAMAGAIIVVAILPNVEEFAIGPKGVNAKLRRVEEHLERQSGALAQQQRIINDLVIYSLAAQPYDILHRIEDGVEFLYDHYSPNEDHRRWAYALLDGGLIEPRRERSEWLQFDQNFHRRNISEFAKTTPAGHILVSVREKRA